ncbi:MAG: hypothetical protein OSA02_07085 [Schleiferiaceae bacterium]|jgi:hypothetical protein|nr:hypothetical protein [Schleiferiaceae bacterium]
MKKNFLFIAIALFLIASLVGTYQYFRSPTKAIEQNSVFTGASMDFAQQYQTGMIHANDIIQLEGEIIAHEEHSLELIGGVLILRDDTETQQWPKSGSHSFKAIFNGVEVDDFFGDTLYRFNGGFLLDQVKLKHSNQTNGEE